MKKICFALLTLTFSLTVLANPLLDLVESLAGVRDFYLEFELVMRVKSQEQYQESTVSGDIAVRNLEDFYLLIKEPSVVSQLSFAYISRTKRLYSSFPGYTDMENVELPLTNIVEVFLAVLKMIQTPVVVTKFDGDTLTITPTVLIAGKSNDPVVFKMKVKEGLIEEFLVTNKSGDEYIKIKVKNLVLNAKVDHYFHFVQ
ncbi:hypothetical protein ACSFC1_03045 [Pseudothermotoga sp. U03pept]|uniref:hypothetical protein n=1 Tax=Pseudothermotoga sp. U03pept TaxID=3447012 RepID=UPI003EFDFE8D